MKNIMVLLILSCFSCTQPAVSLDRNTNIALAILIDQSAELPEGVLLYDPNTLLDKVLEITGVDIEMLHGVTIAIIIINRKSFNAPHLTSIEPVEENYWRRDESIRQPDITKKVIRLHKHLISLASRSGDTESNILRSILNASNWFNESNATERYMLIVSDYIQNSNHTVSLTKFKDNPSELMDTTISMRLRERMRLFGNADLDGVTVLLGHSENEISYESLSPYAESLFYNHFLSCGAKVQELGAL